MDSRDEFCSFMEEYTVFFEKVVDEEREKLSAMLSHNLERIEAAITKQQASMMEIGNLEKRRAKAQENAGFSGLTFREIIPKFDKKRQESLNDLLSRFQDAVSDVKFNNDRSIQTAETSLRLFAVGDLHGADTYTASAYGDKKVKRMVTSKFETKI